MYIVRSCVHDKRSIVTSAGRGILAVVISCCGVDADQVAAMRLVLVVALTWWSVCDCTIWYEPQQTHIAVGERPDQMVIVWSTINDTKASTVLYGTNGKLKLEASGVREKFVDNGTLKRSQFIHRVVLKGLAPDTEYSYVVGCKAYGWSNLFTFRTWPQGEKWSPSLAVFGDMGNVNPQSLPRLEMDALTGMYDAILHVGDFAYNMETDNARVGDEFMRQIEPLATRLPYMTCPGNHEQAYNFSNYKSRFWMPGDEDKRMYYSFTMGPIRFISVATELFFYNDGKEYVMYDQYDWLEKELAKANLPENRAKQPWVITFGHRPMYCSNKDGDDCTKSNSVVRVGLPDVHLKGWEELFYRYGVDVELWAHEHSYERLWPIYDTKVYNGSYEEPYTNPKAPVHIITGSAGCYSDHDPFKKKASEWSAFRSLDYGYTRMKVYNQTHLYMEQVSDDQNGAIIDKVMIIKNVHGPYSDNPKPFAPMRDPFRTIWKSWQKAKAMDSQ